MQVVVQASIRLKGEGQPPSEFAYEVRVGATIGDVINKIHKKHGIPREDISILDTNGNKADPTFTFQTGSNALSIMVVNYDIGSFLTWPLKSFPTPKACR